MKKLILLLAATTMLTGCVGAIHPRLNQDNELLRSKPKVVTFANKKVFDSIPELDGPPIPCLLYTSPSPRD